MIPKSVTMEKGTLSSLTGIPIHCFVAIALIFLDTCALFEYVGRGSFNTDVKVRPVSRGVLLKGELGSDPAFFLLQGGFPAAVVEGQARDASATAIPAVVTNQSNVLP